MHTVCNSFGPIEFTHIPQGYFAATEVIIWLHMQHHSGRALAGAYESRVYIRNKITIQLMHKTLTVYILWDVLDKRHQ